MAYDLKSVTKNFQVIPITAGCVARIKDYARLAGSSEIYGFLLTDKESEDGIVRKVILAKNQKVSGASAKLESIAAAESKSEIEELGCRALGFWHSHGGFGVFHSGVDDGNMDILYRSFAADNEERKTVKKNDTNYRQIDHEKGVLIYRLGDIEILIGIEDSQKPIERRFLSEDSLKTQDIGELVAGITKDFKLYLRDGPLVIETDNLKTIEIRKYQDISTVATTGAAYSIVVNHAGDIYGEIAVLNWCSTCEKEESKINKHVRLEVSDDANHIPISDEVLRKEIEERAGIKPRVGWDLFPENKLEAKNSRGILADIKTG